MNKEHIERTRVNNKLPVAREGLPFILSGLVLALIFLFLKFQYPGSFFILLTIFITWFFRDPDRKKEAEENEILSPADGTVIDVWNLDNDQNPLGERCIKISIFMSLFNVHVNRAPATGEILDIDYNPGKFFSANLDKASEENENNRITLKTESGRKIVFVQIAGLIARRIVCWVNIHDYVKTGQRAGMIRFGSRLDVYLPAGSEVQVRSGEKVRAGETTLGYLI